MKEWGQLIGFIVSVIFFLGAPGVFIHLFALGGLSGYFTGQVLGLKIILALITAAAIVVPILPVCAIAGWKDHSWTVWGRIHHVLLIIASGVFIWWLNYWNLMGWRF